MFLHQTIRKKFVFNASALFILLSVYRHVFSKAESANDGGRARLSPAVLVRPTLLMKS